MSIPLEISRSATKVSFMHVFSLELIKEFIIIILRKVVKFISLTRDKDINDSTRNE